MKNAMGSFLMKSVQKEVKGASSEHIKLLSDFNIPLHRYNKLTSDDDKEQLILDHMVTYIKNLLS